MFALYKYTGISTETWYFSYEGFRKPTVFCFLLWLSLDLQVANHFFSRETRLSRNQMLKICFQQALCFRKGDQVILKIFGTQCSVERLSKLLRMLRNEARFSKINTQLTFEKSSISSHLTETLAGKNGAHRGSYENNPLEQTGFLCQT